MTQTRAVIECIEAGPEDADASILLLHGLGADGHDLEGIVPHLNLPADARWRFIFPNAPERPVTINNGMRMRAWYDIDPAAGPDSGRDDIAASTAQTAALIDREKERGVPSQRIVVGGFSQGGVIALETGLGYPTRLAGIVALSTYLHDHANVAERLSLANAEAPIFMAHGLMDPMIPVQRAAIARSTLTDLGYEIAWQEYPMGHEICMEELNALSQWLTERLGA
ncbi:MAG: alpha/beta fold hydrolase [Gammaproteobacteria bacterium]|nr:MAG: alpha/beta fold hydrolase [Gammaproteobacteria bacterium]